MLLLANMLWVSIAILNSFTNKILITKKINFLLHTVYNSAVLHENNREHTELLPQLNVNSWTLITKPTEAGSRLHQCPECTAVDCGMDGTESNSNPTASHTNTRSSSSSSFYLLNNTECTMSHIDTSSSRPYWHFLTRTMPTDLFSQQNQKFESVFHKSNWLSFNEHIVQMIQTLICFVYSCFPFASISPPTFVSFMWLSVELIV